MAVLLYCHITGNMALYGNKAVALKRGPERPWLQLAVVLHRELLWFGQAAAGGSV